MFSLCTFIEPVSLRKICWPVGDNIFKNQMPKSEYERIVEKHATKLILYTILIIIIVVVAFSLMLIGPMHAFIFHGVYAMPTGHILPFGDPNTLRGYAIKILMQSAVGLVAPIAVVAIETASCMIIHCHG